MTTFGDVCYHFDEIDSTNTFLLKLIKDKKVPEGVIVTAKHQTAGRGQRGNTWTDASGFNLALSLYICPDFLLVPQQFYLSKMVCLGVKDALDGFLLSKVSIKWPNDLYIDDEKLGGILIETSSLGKTINDVVVGIGINVNQVIFPDNIPNPISMKLAEGRDFVIEEVLQKLLRCLEHWYDLLKNGNFQMINDAYEKMLYRLNEMASYEVKVKKGQIAEGRIVGKIIGVDQLGHLLISTDKGTHSFDLKEIAFVINN